MTTPVKQKQTELEDLDLTPEQLELIRSLEIAWAQSERGEVRPAREFMEEWRLEQEAEDIARRDSA